MFSSFKTAGRRILINVSWPPRLDEYFVEADMQEVAIEKRRSPTSHLPFMQDLNILVFQELIDTALFKGNIDVEKAAYLKQLLDGAVRESRMGAAWNCTRCMAVGQKPQE